MPQGGLELGEEPIDAAWRELMEETGLGEADVVARVEFPEWVAYEWPDDVSASTAATESGVARCSGGSCSTRSTADIAPSPDGSEFVAWQWVEPAWLIDHVRRLAPRRLRAGAGNPVSDLFTAAAEQHLRSHAPLAARLRPRTLDDVVGQEHLVGPGKPLRRLVEQDRLTSAIFWGPPGTGKTTLALAVAGSTKRVFEQMSAVNAGVKDVREVIERARQRIGEHGRGTILFLDEIHRFTKSQQDALLPAVEDGTLTMIGATTENPFFEVNPPLRSRSTLFRLEPLGPRGHRGRWSAAGWRPRGRRRATRRSSTSSIGPAATAARC